MPKSELKPLPSNLEPLLQPLAERVRKLHAIVGTPPTSTNQLRVALLEHGLLNDHAQLQRISASYLTLETLLRHVKRLGLAEIQTGGGKIAERQVPGIVSAYKQKPVWESVEKLATERGVTTTTIRKILVKAGVYKSKK